MSDQKPLSPNQLYTPGGTILVSGRRSKNLIYINRPADHELYDCCLNGTYSYILTSRQMGKSSLVTRTEQRLREQNEGAILTVYIEITSIGTQSVTSTDAFYTTLINKILDRLPSDIVDRINFQFLKRKPEAVERLRLDFEEWWQMHRAETATARFHRFLEEIILPAIDERELVIFLDEVDALRSLSIGADDFFAQIRSLYNQRQGNERLQRLTFVLIGCALPQDLIQDDQRTPFNIGERIELTDFRIEDAQDFVKGFNVPEARRADALTRIFYWTGGHPYLTNKLCMELAKDPKSLQTNQGIDDKVRTLFLPRNSNDFNIVFVEKQFHDARNREDLLRLLYRVYSGRPVYIYDERFKAHIDELKLSGIVRVENDHLKIRNQIYREYFNTRWMDENLSTLKTATLEQQLQKEDKANPPASPEPEYPVTFHESPVYSDGTFTGAVDWGERDIPSDADANAPTPASPPDDEPLSAGAGPFGSPPPAQVPEDNADEAAEFLEIFQRMTGLHVSTNPSPIEDAPSPPPRGPFSSDGSSPFSSTSSSFGSSPFGSSSESIGFDQDDDFDDYYDDDLGLDDDFGPAPSASSGSPFSSSDRASSRSFDFSNDIDDFSDDVSSFGDDSADLSLSDEELDEWERSDTRRADQPAWQRTLETTADTIADVVTVGRPFIIGTTTLILTGLLFITGVQSYLTPGTLALLALILAGLVFAERVAGRLGVLVSVLVAVLFAFWFGLAPPVDIPAHAVDAWTWRALVSISLLLLAALMLSPFLLLLRLDAWPPRLWVGGLVLIVVLGVGVVFRSVFANLFAWYTLPAFATAPPAIATRAVLLGSGAVVTLGVGIYNTLVNPDKAPPLPLFYAGTVLLVLAITSTYGVPVMHVAFVMALVAALLWAAWYIADLLRVPHQRESEVRAAGRRAAEPPSRTRTTMFNDDFMFDDDLGLDDDFG